MLLLLILVLLVLLLILLFVVAVLVVGALVELVNCKTFAIGIKLRIRTLIGVCEIPYRVACSHGKIFAIINPSCVILINLTFNPLNNCTAVGLCN